MSLQYLSGDAQAKPWVNIPDVLMISEDGIKIFTFYFTWVRVAILSVMFVVLNFVEDQWKKYAYPEKKKKKAAKKAKESDSEESDSDEEDE